MSDPEPFVRGRICTPGATGVIDYDGDVKEVAFPVMLPIKIFLVDAFSVDALEPHGKKVRFQANDVEVLDVDDSWWNSEWERHSHPEDHRWNLVNIITKYGGQTYTDWECGPYPVTENKEFFKKVFTSCRLYNHEDDPDFKNALIDITLLMYGEADDVNQYDQEHIDATMYAIYQLLTCQKFTKSGIDWSKINEEEWLDSMESVEE